MTLNEVYTECWQQEQEELKKKKRGRKPKTGRETVTDSDFVNKETCSMFEKRRRFLEMKKSYVFVSEQQRNLREKGKKS